MNALFTENCLVINALAAAADRYNGSPDTDVISMKNYKKATFLLTQATAGTNTGTATIIAKACSDVSMTGAEAIACMYASKTTGASDTWSAPAAMATTGIVTTANEDTIHAIMIDAADLPTGKPFVYLDLAETVNDPVTGAIIAILTEPRYDATVTALA